MLPKSPVAVDVPKVESKELYDFLTKLRDDINTLYKMPTYVNQKFDQLDDHIDAVVPVGCIIMYGGLNTIGQAPTLPRFLYCDGSAVSRQTYSTLFSVIGTTYGAGDGSTTFNIPESGSSSIRLYIRYE